MDGLTRAFTILGKRWNGVLLGRLADGQLSFTELRDALGPINDSVLAQRLRELTAARLIERTVLTGPPLSTSYQLSPSGLALVPVLQRLAEWADETQLSGATSGTAHRAKPKVSSNDPLMTR